MDKETLSNYGWIVIAVLVLVVMIALATPFGKYISNAVQSTTKGLFSTSQNALNSAGVPGLTIEDQEFDVPDMNHGTQTPAPVPGATFSRYLINPGCHTNTIFSQHSNDCYTIGANTLTWEELKLAENGEKYGYDASVISDTEIGNAFQYTYYLESITLPEGLTTIGPGALAIRKLTSITIPDSVTTIGDYALQLNDFTSITIPKNVTTIGEGAFSECMNLASITFEGTVAQWNAITFGVRWNHWIPATYVQCSDGQVALS